MAQDGAPRHSSLVFPILLITIGAMFLYSNWRPSFDPWPVLTTYWPLILIFLGLGKMWDVTRRRQNPDAASRSSVGATVGILACVLLLFMFLWHGHAFSRGRGFSSPTRHEVRTVDLEGAKTVSADLNIGAGQLTLRGGSSHLMDADFDYNERAGTPQIDYAVDAGKGDLKISQELEGHIGGTRNNWTLHFNNNVPLDLNIDMGAGEGDLRLRDLDVTNLTVNMGAGRVEVDLTGDRKKDLDADIEGGVGQAVIRLPRKIGVIVNATGGIGTIDAAGLKHDGDEYTNAAYGKSPVTLRLKVQGGVGQISLIQEP